MQLRLFAPAVLSLALLAACGEKAAAAASASAKADDAIASEAALDRDIQKEFAEIAADSIRLYAALDQTRATIAANGDFKIGGKIVAIDEAQRALLLAYRTELVALAQAGAELSARSADAATEKLGNAIENVFDREKPGEASDESKSRIEKTNAAAQRICARLPSLLREQDALAATLTAFKPYAIVTQTDVDACGGATPEGRHASEKISRMIGAAIGNPFKAGMVAGFIDARAEKAAKASKTQSATSTGG
jgi:hypothetical protein